MTRLFSLALTLLLLSCSNSELPCAQTRTCDFDDDASVAEGGGTAGGNGGAGVDGGCVDQSCGCVTNDTCSQPTPVCDTGVGVCAACTSTEGCSGLNPVCAIGSSPSENRCVECDANNDCPMALPACVENVCVACTADFGCGELTCKAGPTPVENTCTGCTRNDQCSGGVCADSDCIPCAVDTNDGCIAPNKFCARGASPVQNRCVECLGHTDCTTPGYGACENSACVPCVTADNTGCSGDKPACKAGITLRDNECVQCTEDAQCGQDICRNDECTPCDPTNNDGCGGDTLFCKAGNTPTSNQCVECLTDPDCDGNPNGTLCENNECIGCRGNSDCSDAVASKCTDAKQCDACEIDADCAHIAGKGVCDAGTCVACTIATEEQKCGDKSCNPATKTCTETVRGSRRVCMGCVADSECEDPGNVRCVAMQFKGNANGAFCLRTEAAGCVQPFLSPLTGPSLSGAPTEVYCSINQNATSCQAMRDYLDGVGCAADDDCGKNLGGLCKKVGLSPNKCTVPCVQPEQCGPGNTCNFPTTSHCH